MPSPTKTKSETRLRRGRSRSRSRSRGRSKSPSRKAKQSPSPSRKVKQTTTTSPGRKVAKVQSSPARAVKAEVEEEVVVKSSTKSSISTVSTQSISTSSSLSSSSTVSVDQKAVTPGTRHSARIAEKVFKQESGEGDSKRSIHLQRVEMVSRSSKNMSEYGGPIATFIGMLMLPLLTFSLLWVCSKKSCEPKNFMNLHKLVPRDLASYYDRNAVLVYLGYMAFQLVLYLLPLGRLHQGGSVHQTVGYRSNGFCAMVINLALFVTMWRYKCGLGFVYKNLNQLAVISLVMSLVFSVILYMKGRDLKPSMRHKPGHSGCLSHDFAVGRELNPSIGPIHLKMFMFRTAMMSMMMINWVFMLESYTKTNQLDMPLLLTSVSMTFLVLDMMIFEAGMLNTAMFSHDGFGALFVIGCGLFPVFYSIQAKYLLEHPQTFNNLWLGFFVCLFFVGYIIRRGADSQKDTFRRDPHDPSVANLETMPTTGGRKLLVSGWWGLVRHPNYLGEVINMLAVALLMGHQTIVPYIPVLFAIFNLFVRANMDGKWCRQKHGAAWERYCQRVKYSIIPYVY